MEPPIDPVNPRADDEEDDWGRYDPPKHHHAPLATLSMQQRRQQPSGGSADLGDVRFAAEALHGDSVPSLDPLDAQQTWLDGARP